MKKKLLVLGILPLLALSSCGRGAKIEETKAKEIASAIDEAFPYKHVEKNKTTSSNSFEYYFDITGYIFPKGCSFTFYDDGYVEVDSGDINFFYSFDAKKAQDLYKLAEAISLLSSSKARLSPT